MRELGGDRRRRADAAAVSQHRLASRQEFIYMVYIVDWVTCAFRLQSCRCVGPQTVPEDDVSGSSTTTYTGIAF
jgi:hypothetical protein